MQYPDLDRALRELDSDLDAAECHGMLCGMLCHPARFDARVWLQQVSGASEPTPIGGVPAGSVLWELLRLTQAAIDDQDISFRLLVAEDDAPLPRRIRSMAAWCRGFLSGFGLAGVIDLSALSEDSRGFLRDLEHIVRADHRGADGEQAEREYEEILEYVRIGALMLREETHFRDADESNAVPPTLH